MSQPRIRHLRHRELDGEERGRLRKLGDWIDSITADAAAGGIGDTAASSTFTADSSTDQVTSTTHGLSTGHGPIVLSTDGTLPSGLVDDRFYWVRRVDADTLKLYRSREDAGLDRNAVDIGDAGSGTHQWALAIDRDAVIKYLRQGVWSEELDGLGDIDNVLNHF